MTLKKIDTYKDCRKDWMKVKPCTHPEHSAPSHFFVLPGEAWEHTCPACGKKTIMRGSGATL